MPSTDPADGPPAGTVTLRYWASVRAAAGVDQDVVDVPGPVPLAELAERARALHADRDRFGELLGTCSALVGDRPVGAADPAAVEIEPGSTVEFLPPFAGG